MQDNHADDGASANGASANDDGANNTNNHSTNNDGSNNDKASSNNDANDFLPKGNHRCMFRKLWRPHWIQKNESLNQLVSVFAPKDRHLSSSMSLSDRVSLVVIVDSVGYAVGLSEVFTEIGSKLPASMLESLKRRDARQEYDRQYHKNIDNKRRRGAAKREIIKAALRHNNKSDAETGVNYEPHGDFRCRG